MARAVVGRAGVAGPPARRAQHKHETTLAQDVVRALKIKEGMCALCITAGVTAGMWAGFEAKLGDKFPWSECAKIMIPCCFTVVIAATSTRLPVLLAWYLTYTYVVGRSLATAIKGVPRALEDLFIKDSLFTSNQAIAAAALLMLLLAAAVVTPPPDRKARRRREAAKEN